MYHEYYSCTIAVFSLHVSKGIAIVGYVVHTVYGGLVNAENMRCRALVFLVASLYYMPEYLIPP